MHADEGIEDEQSGLPGVDGVHQPFQVGFEIEAQLVGEDEEDGEGVEVDAAGLGQSLEAGSDVEGGVLGGEEEDGSGIGDGKAAEARGAGGHGEGQFEGQVGLAAFGRAPQHADGLMGPEVFDEPVGLSFGLGRDVGDL